MSPLHHLTRRSFLAVAAGTSAALLAACSQQAQAPAKPADAPKPAAEVKPTAPVVISVPTPAPTAAAAPAAKPTEAPAAPKPAAQAAIKRGGILKLHRQNDWPTHDPHTSQTSSLDMPLFFDYLTRLDKNPATGGYEVKPSLAESWEITDPTTVVFKLRKGIKFHDGTDFNAEAAKWNFDRMMTHPKSAAKNHTATIKEVQVVDANTLKLLLKAPSPALFVNLTSDADNVTAMISPTHAQKVGDTGLAREAVGTGPFKFKEFQTGSHAYYSRFDGYWKQGADGKPLPYPDEVHVKYQQDWNAALLAMRSGDLDVIGNIAGRDVPTVKANPNLVYEEAAQTATMYQITFNGRTGARFAGEKMKKVRQAINYAIDRKTIADTLGQGLGTPNYYHIIPGQIGYSDKVPKYEFNLEKAKQLMAEAGYASGLEVVLDFISRPEDTQNAQLYQQMLAQIGVKLTLQPQERVAWVQKTLAGNFEFATFLSGVRPDPDLVIGYRFAKGGPGNYAGWENAEIDKLLEEGRTTYDTAKRQAAYEKAHTLINDEAYVGFIWRRQGTFVTSKAVKNFSPPWSQLVLNSTEIWLDR
jgi:peptide/nickel transport system substrate-binding protein